MQPMPFISAILTARSNMPSFPFNHVMASIAGAPNG